MIMRQLNKQKIRLIPKPQIVENEAPDLGKTSRALFCAKFAEYNFFWR